MNEEGRYGLLFLFSYSIFRGLFLTGLSVALPISLGLLLNLYQTIQNYKEMYSYVFVNFQPESQRIVQTVQIHFLTIVINGQTDYLCTIIGHEEVIWLRHHSFIVRKTNDKNNGSYVLSIFPDPLSKGEDTVGFVAKLMAEIDEQV